MLTILNVMENICKKINRVIESLSSVTILVMTAIVLAQIVTRYFFGFSLPWSEELTKLLMVWFVLLCIPVLHYDDEHIALTFIFEKLSKKVQIVAQLIIFLLIMGFGIVLSYSGTIYTIDNMHVTLPATGLPRFWLYACLALGGYLLVFEGLTLVLRTLGQLLGKIEYNEEEGSV
jgi:TRAP-type C4-dicarboxylate transport system permease small subunit